MCVVELKLLSYKTDFCLTQGTRRANLVMHDRAIQSLWVERHARDSRVRKGPYEISHFGQFFADYSKHFGPIADQGGVPS
jgi:hypothetical protein